MKRVLASGVSLLFMGLFAYLLYLRCVGG